MSFTLNGTTTSATTNNSGVASLTRSAPAAAGSYPIAISFAGDSGYATASASAALKVNLATPSLKYTGATSATRSKSVTLTATLKTSAGVALAGRTVTFKLNSVTYSGVTSATGTASVAVTAPATAATYSIAVAFAGDAGYNATSTSASVRVR